jgi:hypothetical protein
VIAVMLDVFNLFHCKFEALVLIALKF